MSAENHQLRCLAALRPELQAHFGLAENELIWCGMALGTPDRSSPVSSYFTERAPLDEVVTFRGF